MYIRDTIAAISTPPGNGGIGIIRVSGDKAAMVGARVFRTINNGGLISHRFSFGKIINPDTCMTVDEAMAVFMASPKSYTREDVLELHCHGGRLVVEKVLSIVLECGIRLAEPGEFTRRAFVNGRIDLVQAESVMDIISSQSEAALQLAQSHRDGALSSTLEQVRLCLLKALALIEAYIDFPEDDIGADDLVTINKTILEAKNSIDILIASFDEGRVIRDGISVLIVGKPNAGKSSLLNCLLKENRAIVTDIPGTTRDILEETVQFDGLAVRLLDTAGIRVTDDVVEREGISRALGKVSQADIVLAVFDASVAFSAEDALLLDSISSSKVIAVINKSDLQEILVLPPDSQFIECVRIAALTGAGIDQLKTVVVGQFLHKTVSDSREYAALSKARHKDALVSASKSLQCCSAGVYSNVLELLSLDVKSALDAVGSVTGHTATDDVLDVIFSSFCIGK